jgi:hypothetical protein
MRRIFIVISLTLAFKTSRDSSIDLDSIQNQIDSLKSDLLAKQNADLLRQKLLGGNSASSNSTDSTSAATTDNTVTVVDDPTTNSTTTLVEKLGTQKNGRDRWLEERKNSKSFFARFFG